MIDALYKVNYSRVTLQGLRHMAGMDKGNRLRVRARRKDDNRKKQELPDRRNRPFKFVGEWRGVRKNS